MAYAYLIRHLILRQSSLIQEYAQSLAEYGLGASGQLVWTSLIHAVHLLSL